MQAEQKQCACGTLFTPSRPEMDECRECRRTRYRTDGFAKRKQREREAPGSHTAKEWYDRIQFQNSLCFYCFHDLITDRDLFCGTKDHLVPISRGGSNFIENIVAACWPCNRRKGRRTANEFCAYLAKQSGRFSEVSTLLDPTTTRTVAGSHTGITPLSTLPIELRDPLFRMGHQHAMRETDNPAFWESRRALLKHQAAMMGRYFQEAAGQMQLNLDMPSSVKKTPEAEAAALTVQKGMDLA